MTLDNLKYALILNNKLLLDRLKTFLHNHDNLPTLNGLSANDAGALLFNGNLVNEQYSVTDEEIKAMVDQVIAELDKETGGTDTPTPAIEFEWWSPRMTSNTTPSPYVASASDEPYPDRHALWEAFNGDTTTQNDIWFSRSSDGWIQFDFSQEVLVQGLRIYQGHTEGTYNNALPKVFDIVASNDGVNWHTLLATTNWNGYILNAENIDIPMECMLNDNSTKYRYYKVNCKMNDGCDCVIIGDIQFYKQKDT